MLQLAFCGGPVMMGEFFKVIVFVELCFIYASLFVFSFFTDFETRWLVLRSHSSLPNDFMVASILISPAQKKKTTSPSYIHDSGAYLSPSLV